MSLSSKQSRLSRGAAQSLIRFKSVLAKSDPLVWSHENCWIQDGNLWSPYGLRAGSSRDYSFLKGIFDVFKGKPERDIEVVVMKPTQMGLTTLAMVLMMYYLCTTGRNVIYMLPDQGQLSDFAHNRLDKLIENSPQLSALFSDISNVGIKVARSGALYLRGSNSSSKIEEIPAGFVIRDEIDKMNQQNAELALKRLSGQPFGWILDLSHPTYPDAAIDARFKSSSRHRYYVICPNCGEKQTLDWPHNVNIENETLVCRACDKGKFGQKSCPMSGFWEPEDPGNPIHGFHFNQLISPTVSISKIIREWEAAKGKPHKLEIFHNTVLALPYINASEVLTPLQVQDCCEAYGMTDSGQGTFMGVDVNRNHLHVWVEDGKSEKVLWAGVVECFDRLDDLVRRFRPQLVVIDANPDWHKTHEWANGLRKRTGVSGKVLRWEHTESKDTEPKVDHENTYISWSRTRGLDELHDRFRIGGVQIPADLPRDVIDQICAPKRVLVESPGKPVRVKYVEDSPDHFAFAAMFCLLARKVRRPVSAADRYRIQTPSVEYRLMKSMKLL